VREERALNGAAKQDPQRPAGDAPLGGLSPLSFAKAIWNYRFLCLSVWIALTAAVVLVVHRLPPTYRAETSILVESQRIPEKFVSSTVTPELQDRLNTLSDQVLSYPRLMDLIRKFDLYRVERKTHSQEEVVDLMRSDIKIKAADSTPGHAGSFEISYQGSNPVVITRVVQEIANFFIDENLRERQGEAEGTSQFLEGQLAEAKQRLEAQEAMLSRYKMQYNGELPEQEGALLASSGQMKVELTGIQDALNRAQQNKTMLESTLANAQAADATLEQMLQEGAPAQQVGLSIAGAQGLPAPPQKESERLEAELATLRMRYGDQYPDVRHLKEELERVREEEKNAPPAPSKASPGETAAQTAPPVPARARLSPQAQQNIIASRERIADVKRQMASVNSEIANLEKQRQSVMADLNSLESRIENLPLREQQLASVTRDYETTQKAYQSLLDKKLSADVAADMEKRQKAERFVPLDPARVPERPIKPKRQILDGGGCLLALIISIALGVVLELRKGVLLGEWELPPSVTILGRVPEIALSPVSGGRHG
jgi:polysaccharide biosynthesis transport protein